MINHDYLEQFNESSVRKDIDIVYDTDNHITNSDIVSGTFSLNESAFATKELRFGSLVSSEMSVKLYNTVPNLMDKEISVSIALDNMASNPLKIGKYKVLEDKPTTDRLYKQIKAYDNLYEVINKEVVSWYEGLLFPMTLKVFRDSFFAFLGIEQENTTLINDDMVVDKTILANSIPGKQVLSAICELNGAIGRMNRDGKFTYVVLDANPTSRITIDNIASKSGSYEDFECQPITKVQIRQTTDDIGAIVGEDGNTYIMQDNFLVYGKSASDLTTIATNLLSIIKGITYTPFNVKAIYGNPCYEIGDAITIVTANKTFNSYMFNRTLKGIQAMTDNIKADGVEYYTENLNSANTQIQQLARQTNELSRTVEETKSTITKIEGNTSLSNTAVGNSITTTDSGEYPLIELYGYGKSEQKSYKGINLVDLSVPSGLNGVSNYSFDNETGLVSFDYDGNYPMPSFLANHLIGKKVYLYYKNVVNSNADASNAVNFAYKASDGSTKYIGISASGTTIPSDATSCTFQIISNNSTTVLSGTFSANIMVSSEATETYEQYVGGEASPNPSYPQDIVSVADDGDLVVKSCGKNLLENTQTTKTSKGITFTVNDDGSVTLNGTATGNVSLVLNKTEELLHTLKNRECILSGCASGGSASTYRLQYYSDTRTIVDVGNGATLNITDNPSTWNIAISVYSGTVCNNLVFKPMIRLASIDDDTYEPYKATQATIPLTDSLRGIKVTEGGNYTDETGQQWVCDTLEKYADGSGKLVQRVYGETLTESKIFKVNNTYVDVGAMAYISPSYKTKVNDLQTLIMCNKAVGVSHHDRAKDINMYRICCTPDASAIMIRYPATVGEITLEQAKADFAGTEVVYALDVPIEIPLTAEQIAEIEKLSMFNPITHVTTDDIGDIAIEYYKNNANADVVAQGKQGLEARVTTAESSITQNAEQIALKVSKGDISSEISQEASLISIKGNRFELVADNVEITKDGKLRTSYIIADQGFKVKKTLVGDIDPIDILTIDGDKADANSEGVTTLDVGLGYLSISKPVLCSLKTKYGDIDMYNVPFIIDDYTDNAGWHIREYSDGSIECEGSFVFANISPTGTFGGLNTSYMDLNLPANLFKVAPNKIYNISPISSFGSAVGNITQNDSSSKIRLYCMHTYTSATTFIATVRCWQPATSGIG